MAKLNLSIIMDDGRTVVVCPEKNKIEFPDAMDFVPAELEYVLETVEKFMIYVSGD